VKIYLQLGTFCNLAVKNGPDLLIFLLKFGLHVKFFHLDHFYLPSTFDFFTFSNGPHFYLSFNSLHLQFFILLKHSTLFSPQLSFMIHPQQQQGVSWTAATNSAKPTGMTMSD
jgi:hypothetical protein